jgi:hypothetical protein
MHDMLAAQSTAALGFQHDDGNSVALLNDSEHRREMGDCIREVLHGYYSIKGNYKYLVRYLFPECHKAAINLYRCRLCESMKVVCIKLH